MHGSHGPSGLHACEWRSVLTHFNQTSIEFCKTIAKLSYTIASKVVPHGNLTAYNACRLIPLDKNPGVRPIGIGEVLSRIIGKTITQCIKSDLKNLGKYFQLCLGQKCGIEYAIHSLRKEFEKPETEAILLIDAENAFNSLNGELALKNVEILCPALHHALANSYKHPSNFYVNNTVSTSTEGTTQGDPLAMAMYGIGIIPLIELLQKPNVAQKCYADDGSAAGDLKSLRALLDNLDMHGKAFGYNMKPSKCQLIVKENCRESAIKVFEGTNIKMVDGFRVHGSVIGTPSACDKYIESEIEKTATLTEKLSKIAKTSPQNAYSCYTKGVQNKLSFLTRTTPEAFKKVDETEKNVRPQLLPSITGKNHITDEDRNFFALPLRMGGLHLLSNTDFSKNYEWSRVICDPLENTDTEIAETEQTLINRNIKTEKQNITISKKAKITENCSSDNKLTKILASQKGASNWPSVLPLKNTISPSTNQSLKMHYI